MKVIKKNVTVWKTVKVEGSKRLSWMATYLPGSWVVEYLPGRWTYPTQEGSALFARTGESLLGSTPTREVWRCEADIVDGELDHGGNALMTWSMNLARSLTAFWHNPSKYKVRHGADGVCGCSDGVWCSRIKLVELA